MDKAYVELEHVSKRFGDVQAVTDVSLDVPEGQITTLLGPSGCGKTTLLRLLAGFFPPDGGAIRIKGERVDHLPPQRRRTAIVFQDYALFPHLSVFENVAYGLRRRHVGSVEIRRRALETLAFLGLRGLEAAFPLTLSGGQQQRVALARALVVEPDVLLLDEPLSNLDAKLRTRVRTELKEIQQSLGKTTIFVTHDQEEALSLSDIVAVMDHGRVRQVGTPAEIYLRPVDRFVADFVGIANFLPGRVAGVEAGVARVECALGILGVPARGVREGAEVVLVLRPETLHLSPAAGDAHPVRLRSTSFLGGARRHVVEFGEFQLYVEERSARPAWEAGQDLWLRVDAEQVHVVPAEAA